MDIEKYQNMDNGIMPTLKIKKNPDMNVEIYKIVDNIIDDDNDDKEREYVLTETFKVNRLLLGKAISNEATRYSGGEEMENTSFLLELNNNVYVYVGPLVYSFKSLYKITDFISSVGNSHVVYPWAVDTQNNYYLMDYDNVVLLNTYKIVDKNNNDPWNYYYDHKSKGIKLPIEVLIKRYGE